MRSALLIMFLTLLVVAANSAEAIDVSEMKRTMASNSCPPNPTRVDPISAAQVCAATYSRPCNATSNQCFDENQRCVAEVNKENYVIGDYNVYIAKCQAADANRQGGNKFTPNSSLSTERQRQESEAKAAQEAAIKAQGEIVRRKAEEAKIRELYEPYRRAEEEGNRRRMQELTRQKDEEMKTGATDEERAAQAASNQRAAQAARDQRKRELEEAQSKAELAEAAKWRCFGTENICYWDGCKSMHWADGPRIACQSQCSEPRSAPGGYRYCFKAF